MTAKEAAEKWGVSSARVRVWIKEGRVRATLMKTPMGCFWVIDDDAEKPTPKKAGRKKRQ